MEKELEETQRQLTEAEQYHTQLEEAIIRIREEKEEKPKPHPLAVQLGLIGSNILDGLLKKNIPQLNGLLGGVSTEQPDPTATETPEAEATFKKKGDTPPAPQMTEQQQRNLRNLEMMEQAFGGDELQIVIAIIQKLMEKPEQVIPVAQFLNLQNNNEHA